MAIAAQDAAAEDAAYKDRVRSLFTERSASYDAGNAFHPPLCDQLVALAGVHPGARVLDVCCGTGFVAFAAAEAAGPGGRVVGVDISEAMLDQARGKLVGDAEGAHTEFMRGDVETVEFPNYSFDYILCSNGMAYLSDKPAAAAKFRRWLRPGGCLAFNNPQSPMIPVTDILISKAADMFGAELQDAGADLGSEPRIRQLLAGAGFSNIMVQRSQDQKVFNGQTPEEFAARMFDMMRTFPTAPMHLQLSDAQIQQLRDAYIPEAVPMAEDWQSSGDIVVPYTMLWPTATV